ncbi:hypothetical protein EAI_16677 [Harpegnathos saltator]|uniref:Uncharacterized protein n=1 Tax=Harpegnathos saltator TaxID=610380 RepID=E2BEQ8_HARSA|nr:hypothetical protein EAI_16677 [Harpegnathos saltator]
MNKMYDAVPKWRSTSSRTQLFAEDTVAFKPEVNQTCDFDLVSKEPLRQFEVIVIEIEKIRIPSTLGFVKIEIDLFMWAFSHDNLLTAPQPSCGEYSISFSSNVPSLQGLCREAILQHIKRKNKGLTEASAKNLHLPKILTEELINHEQHVEFTYVTSSSHLIC